MGLEFLSTVLASLLQLQLCACIDVRILIVLSALINVAYSVLLVLGTWQPTICIHASTNLGPPVFSWHIMYAPLWHFSCALHYPHQQGC